MWFKKKNIWGGGCRDFTYSDGFTRRFMGISRGYMVIRTGKNCWSLRVNMLTHVDSPMDKSDVLFSDKPISEPREINKFRTWTGWMISVVFWLVFSFLLCNSLPFLISSFCKQHIQTPSKYKPEIQSFRMVSARFSMFKPCLALAVWGSQSVFARSSQRQVLPALVLLGGMLCLPRSPRWLVQQGRSDEALWHGDHGGDQWGKNMPWADFTDLYTWYVGP